MPSDHDTARCDTCLARIKWAITVNGRRQAVNADPDTDGNLAVYRDGTGTLRARVLTKERDRLEGTEWQAMPHAATCTSPRPKPSPSRPGRRAAARPGTWPQRWPR